jgi:hypothetical protein
MLREVSEKYLKFFLSAGFYLKEDDSYVILFYKSKFVKSWSVGEATQEEIEGAIGLYLSET